MKNLKIKNYSINYSTILKFENLSNTVRFSNVDLFDRTHNVGEKYRILFKQLREDQKNFDILIDFLEKKDNIDDYFKKEGSLNFYSLTKSNNNITADSRKLRQFFADYVNSIAEFLEIFRYTLARKYSKRPGGNFKSFVKLNASIIQGDINYLKKFYEDFWNKQKHVKNLPTTPFEFNNGIIALPKIDLKESIFNKEIEIFSNEILEKIIEIIKLNQ